jgi:hypothetical protein
MDTSGAVPYSRRQMERASLMASCATFGGGGWVGGWVGGGGVMGGWGVEWERIRAARGVVGARCRTGGGRRPHTLAGARGTRRPPYAPQPPAGPHLPGAALGANQPDVRRLGRLVQRDVLPDEHADADAGQVEAVEELVDLGHLCGGRPRPVAARSA